MEALPGGLSFNRIDTKIGKRIRLKVHFHLPKVLKPEKPFQSLKDLQKQHINIKIRYKSYNLLKLHVDF